MAIIHREALNRLITRIQNSADNKYVSETMGKVQIPVFFVHVLYWLLSKQEEIKKVELYIIASTLLKMGIDMHEEISVNRQNDNEERLQQLAILSGDHYSSLFYLYLARQHEAKGIRHLSDATCRINEWKMSLHAQRNGEELLDPKKAWFYFAKISSELVTVLANFFHVKEEIKILAASALVTLYDADRLTGSWLNSEVWLNEISEKKWFLKQACDQLDDPGLKSLLEQLPQFEPVAWKESDGV